MASAWRVDAGELVPGDAVTLWWAVFNNPEFCEGGCNGPDLRNPDVQAGLFYGGGEVVNEDGTLTIISTRAEGDASGVDTAHMDFAGAQTGIIDAQTAEIHVALRSHGAAHEDPALLAEQLGTFTAACNPECSNQQAATFLPPDVVFDNQVMHLAGTTTEVPTSTSKLTRDDDGVSVRVDAGELVPGDAVTLWWAVFNNPEFCEGGCNGPDLRNPDVQAGLFYGGGEVVNEDGTLTIISTRAEGDASGVDTAHMDFCRCTNRYHRCPDCRNSRRPPLPRRGPRRSCSVGRAARYLHRRLQSRVFQPTGRHLPAAGCGVRQPSDAPGRYHD